MLRETNIEKQNEIINDLRNSMSIIAAGDKQFSSLFSTLFKINWILNPEVGKSLMCFYLDLVSANNSYTHIIFENLVDNLYYTLPPEEGDESSVLLVKESLLSNSLETIKLITHLVPTSVCTLCQTIIKLFPHKTRSVENQVSAFTSTLMICDSIQDIKENLWSLMLEKMIDIDVEMKNEEEEEVEQTVFATDNDEEDEMSCKMDKLMIIMMDYFLKECNKGTIELANVYKFLLKFFEEKILLTHRCRVTQFILFRICSYDNELSTTFIERLINFIYTIDAPLILRLSCTSYLASFVARANYLTLDIIKTVIDYLFEYCTKLITEIKVNNNDIYFDFENNNNNYFNNSIKLFYSCFQSVLYILCFRTQNILKEPDGLEYLQNFPWLDIFLSTLNPVKVCSKDIINEFLNETDRCSLFDHSLVEKLQSTPVTPSLTPHTPRTPATTPIIEKTDIFFPFDPYPLKNSNRYFDHIYKHWEPIDYQSNTEESSDDDSDEENEMEESENDSADERKKKNDLVNSLENLIFTHESYQSMDTGV